LVCWNLFCGVIRVAIIFYNVDPILYEQLGVEFNKYTRRQTWLF
jgi:hypothetical protein